MNILQVINSKWWNAETDYAFSLTKGLRDEGHAVSIVALSGKPVVKKALEEGINCFQTTALNGYNPFSAIKFIKELLGIIKDEEIEVINCHRSEGFPLVLLAALLASKKPAIVRTRGDQRQVRKGFLNKLLYEKYTQAIITSGKIVKKDLISRLGLKDEKIKVIYSSVDKEKFKNLAEYNDANDIREEFGIAKKETLISILGRVSEVKGHKYFIEAASIILKKFPQTRFLIIVKEEDPNLPELKAKIKQA